MRRINELCGWTLGAKAALPTGRTAYIKLLAIDAHGAKVAVLSDGTIIEVEHLRRPSSQVSLAALDKRFAEPNWAALRHPSRRIG